jgi:hypothetical protein
MKHTMKSKMQKKQWSKNPNKEFIVGSCKWCNKEIINTESFITLATKENACIKCYRSSGQMLPFWDKEHK